VKKSRIFVLIVVLLVLGSFLVFHKSPFSNKPKKSEATSSAATISVKADWDQGAMSNIVSAEAGNIQISDKGIGDLLYNIGQTHPEQITVSHHEEWKVNAVDNNDATSWAGVNNFSPGMPECTEPIPNSWWQIDLGEIHTDIQKFRLLNSVSGMPQDIQISTDGVNFTTYQTV
jgi:hypothetical protein